jgi:phage anti-repressor protein
MELQILVSKRGTKVVTASNLHSVLGLPAKHYAANTKKWLTDVYEFRDGIRKPKLMNDYARRSGNDHLVDDYYLSVELAKLITLNSKSKVKQKFATWLLHLEDKVENAELLTTDQVFAVLELAKVMGLVSCQAASEKWHLQTYEERNNGSAANWWSFRSDLLGYSTEKLKEALKKLGKKTEGKSRRQMLMQIDPHEMIRSAVIDLFMGIGKTERYAKNLGNLAKVFARELKVDIFDDRENPVGLLPKMENLNVELLTEIKTGKVGSNLKVWENL